MRDVYRDAMDSVKAPDALVEKTLQLMLEEHNRRKAKPKANARFPQASASAAKASAPKSHWIAQFLLPAAACLCLCLIVVVPRLLGDEADMQTPPSIDSHYSPGLETPAQGARETDGNTESIESPKRPVEAVTTDSLATRSGPGTAYRETGTYPIKGESVRLISRAYDAGGLCWVQCEVLYGSKLRRVYTGLQRFDADSFDPDSVPIESPPGEQATATATTKAMYGPGDGYGTYDGLTVDKGQAVAIIAVENEYAQVEWATSVQSYRAWVPLHTLRTGG